MPNLMLLLLLPLHEFSKQRFGFFGRYFIPSGRRNRARRFGSGGLRRCAWGKLWYQDKKNECNDRRSSDPCGKAGNDVKAAWSLAFILEWMSPRLSEGFLKHLVKIRPRGWKARWNVRFATIRALCRGILRVEIVFRVVGVHLCCSSQRQTMH
jgi:hypothetical protein